MTAMTAMKEKSENKSKRSSNENERWGKRALRTIKDIEIALSGLDRALIRGLVLYHLVTTLFA